MISFRLAIALAVVVPAPLVAQDCNLPAAGGGAAPPADWRTVTGGHFEGQAITVPAGTTLRLTSDLTIVANGDLTIGGNIALPKILKPGVASPNIALASRNGTVLIQSSASVGGGNAAPGAQVRVAARPAIANGVAGGKGSLIRVIGPTIGIKGGIVGNAGGYADTTVARARGPAGGPNSAATARGGPGGAGGGVLLCAERIDIGEISPVVGGEGGAGGEAIAYADKSGPGQAWGGQGGPGGNVVFRGAQIRLGGSVAGGKGGDGNRADASGGPVGGNAWSQAGNGGKGGTVKFEAGAQVANTRVPTAGDGGTLGGDASAAGGNGEHGIFKGGPGGNAEARGGSGGVAGDAPIVPLAGGGTAQGVAGRNGSGGNASAYPGDGGDATVGLGGDSGSGMALGGANGAGVAPGAPVVARPVAGGLWAGGAAGIATQNGQP